MCGHGEGYGKVRGIQPIKHYQEEAEETANVQGETTCED